MTRPHTRGRKVAHVGKYFGRQPRYSQQEAEAQAKQAIDALVSRGRPPAEEWKGLANRMGDINRELAAMAEAGTTRARVSGSAARRRRRAATVDRPSRATRRRRPR